MLKLALILFAIAALGGLTLGLLHIKKGGAPVPLALLHGSIAATALILLIITVLKAQTAGLLMVSMILFIVAAIGGLVLFANHLRTRPLPRPLIIIHGAVAATAFVILLIYILR